jgi:hydroxyacyl-ACP dehydratase HTD2-like protein with hotdog domain
VEFSSLDLFRFSALTFNAHRIHWDRNFCQHHGYEGLVVHGPLLGSYALYQLSKIRPAIRKFEYSLKNPLCLNSETDKVMVDLMLENETTGSIVNKRGVRILEYKVE